MAVKSYKGMDKDMKCRGFQYEVGGEYETDKAKACEVGFHACERPLDVFNYYPPAESRFFEVEQDGDISREDGDSKVASTKLKVGAEIGIPGLVKAQIEYVKARTNAEHTVESVVEKCKEAQKRRMTQIAETVYNERTKWTAEYVRCLTVDLIDHKLAEKEGEHENKNP